MVSGTDLFLGLFDNLAVFIVLIAAYGFLLNHFEKFPRITRQLLLGLSFGLFAIVCMHAKIPVAVGVIVDQRNTIVALGGAFGGPLAAILCAIIASAYRIYLGGSGALAGVVGIGLSALVGALFHRLRNRIDSIFKAILSSLAATAVILPGFLFYEDMHTGWELMKAIALPYGLAVFIGLLFVGLLLAHQERSHLAVVELKKSERRYRESEQRLDLALSGANEGIWDWNLQTGAIIFDTRYYTISGYAPDEFPASFEAWEKRVHADDLDRAKTSIRQYLSGDIDRYEVEFRFLHKNGHYMWILGKGKIVSRAENGDPIRFIGTHSDITGRKKIEESLLITQFIYNKASIDIYRIASDARIIDVNRQAAATLGYSVEELRHMSIFDIDPQVDADEWKAMWQSLCENRSEHFERIHRRKDGSELLVEITSNLLEYQGKQFSVAFAQDITERKVWENNLIASERRYQDLFNQAPVGYVVTDNNEKEPCVKDVNNTFLQLLGYRREAVLGTPLSCYYTEESRDKLLGGTFQRAIGGEFIHDERDLLTRDNRLINTVLHAHPIYDADNQVTGTRATFLDITDRKNAEKEARRLQSALLQAQKMEAIGTLAGGIAHDFNNILGAIIGYTQLAMIHSKENPNVQEYTGQVCVACDRAKELIQQILAFSRQRHLEKQPLDLGLLIKETLKLIRASIPSSIEIQQNLKTNIGTVEADQTQIHQVVMNLCANAAHAMNKDGGRLTVELDQVRISKSDCSAFDDIEPGLYLRLTVADTGHGMDDYTVSRIFEPYFTTKEVGEGTGMGLALVHGIVKDHGGDIKVYSEPGFGTTFRLLFPTIKASTEESVVTPDALPRGSGLILFVDDEKPLVDVGKHLLEVLGYQVETRTSPNDALEALRAKPNQYDLVITDMTMPKMNGDKLAAQIRRIRPDLPIIICTGFSRALSPEKATEMGISGILMKPLTLVDLACSVKTALDEANASG